MIHNIPQPALEQEFADRIADDPNITLRKGFSIHAVKQVNAAFNNQRVIFKDEVEKSSGSY